MPRPPGPLRLVAAAVVFGTLVVYAVKLRQEPKPAAPRKAPVAERPAPREAGDPSPRLVPAPSPAAPVAVAPTAVAPIPATSAATDGTTSRWYEFLSDGAKAGWTHVEWSRSTWRGHETVRDVTSSHSRTVRQMLGTEDAFESGSVQTTERGTDGTLYAQSGRSTERGGRVTTAELTWTGDGYDFVKKIEGGSASDTTEERHRVDVAAPAHVDAEALVSERAARGELKVGDRFVRRDLNVLAGRVDEKPVVVVADEEVVVPAGRAKAWKLEETDPATGGKTFLWIDREGAVVRLKDLSTEIRRVAGSAEAERSSGVGASFSITAEANPPVQRVFAADAFDVEVGVRPDPDRPRPEFPDSPWSRTLDVAGDDAAGFRVRVRLSAYDTPDAKATIPVRDPAFAKFLEATALMPCLHPDVKAAASRAVAGETDARKAARRIADFVYTLDKESPEVAEASALEILRDRKGDCSEHALLFVALCRAAGIPARRCSGFVCVGSDWGSHAWAEIWCGAWIGVDPTTDDVGTSARYLFFGYDDDGDSRAGTVSARARGRLSFRGLSLTEGDDVVDLRDEASLRRFDPTTRRAVDRLAGLDLRDLPEGWTVSFAREDWTIVTAGDAGTVRIRVVADQGQRTPAQLGRIFGDQTGTFAGRPAAVMEGFGSVTYGVGTRKRILILRFEAGRRAKGSAEERIAALVAAFEKVAAPTFAERAGSTK